MSAFAGIEAKARAKARLSDPRARAKRYAAAESARRVANLKAEGIVIPLSEWLGHNNGPDWFVDELYLEFCWKRSHARVWAPPTQEIGIRRARKAEALGVTYREFVLEILERGRYLDEQAAAALREGRNDGSGSPVTEPPPDDPKMGPVS
jgi:hypothetical protein